MKIPQKDYIEQNQDGDFKEITSTISEKNLSLVLDNVTKNLYSDPIGAFVRELTSNAVDANKKNDKSEKIKIHIYKESDAVYFEVKDEGKGMTPDVFENVYMSWFESDKRNDDTQIGGWGIGSKSPLAYAEFYELTTIAEGIQYEYEIVRQAPAPKATLINSFPTNKKSGTIVKVEVKSDDDFKLHKATIKQLAYFDNVIVTNELWYYDNHFKILEHDLFVVRSDGNYPFDKDMHIVIGQVAYPINWNILGMNPIRVPVGIKFDISELPVDLSREVIRYVDDTDIDVKSIIMKKIKETVKVLKSLYIDSLKTNNLKDYIAAIDNPKSVITLAGYNIPFGIQMKDANYFFTYEHTQFSFSKDKFYYLLNAFECIDLSKKEGKNRTTILFNELNIIEHAYSKTGIIDHWASLYYKNDILIRRKNITRRLLYIYASILGLTLEKVVFGRMRTVLQVGATKKVLLFLNALEEYIIEKTKNYDVVPSKFIEEEKARQEALKEERKGNITYYNEEGKKTVTSLKHLIEDYRYVFYINRNASDEEKRAYMALYKSFAPSFNHQKLFSKKFPRILVAIFSDSTINKIKNKKKEIITKHTIKENGKKKRIYTKKETKAFLSADKMFKYTELYKQFHILRYTTTLCSYNYHKIGVSSISVYYKKLLKSIPETSFYRINKTDKNDGEYIYPYYYFKDQIDSITKNRNCMHEKALEKLTKVGDSLFAIYKAKVQNDDSKMIINRIIKEKKLLKLNTNLYEQF